MANTKTNLLADDVQREIYKKFPTSHFLSNPTNCDHFYRWNTFFRRNLHRFAIDYLKIKLYEYQALALYEMGANNQTVIIASRAAAKSFIIALYACERCILFPNTHILLSSATKGQSELIVEKKIKGELMSWSPILAKEIESIKSNQNNTVVKFRNQSDITVVLASDRARGNRSNVIVREEFRQISKLVDDSVLSPCQILRQSPYMLQPYYANKPELKEEPVDIYISSSWLDNGHWMWKLVDTAYNQMLNNQSSCLLAFDEAVVLKHGIKSMYQLVKEKRKQDTITWQVEFLNTRLKENTAAFFTYSMLQKNQVGKQPFYPRTLLDFQCNRKNPYAIPKMPGEIRIVACDMAFITNDGNDNSVFSCLRLLPESVSHSKNDGGEVSFDNGYRIVVPYLESVQGGEVRKQAIRIRELFNDFDADYICLDTRNAGVAVYQALARPLFDEDRNIEYPPLSCMNNETISNMIKVEGAEPRIFAINASQKLNSDIALNFRRRLAENKIDFLVNFETAKEDILPKINEYVSAVDGDTAAFYEVPFLETQALFAETVDLIYEKKQDTGLIVIREQGSNRKDRYTSVSYGVWLCELLERDLLTNANNYEYSVLIN